jgi:hypothetical protein
MRVGTIALVAVISVGALAALQQQLPITSDRSSGSMHATCKVIEANVVGAFPLSVSCSDFQEGAVLGVTPLRRAVDVGEDVTQLKPGSVVHIVGAYSSNGQFISATSIELYRSSGI